MPPFRREVTIMRRFTVLVTVTLLLLLMLPALAEETAPPAPGPTQLTAEFAEPGSAIPAQRLAVLKLRVQGPYASELREWLPALIEERLAESGWTVLARGESMQAIQQEQHLPGVDPTTAPAPNKLYGATALLELTARAEVKDIDAAANLGFISIGGLVKAKFYLTGNIVDTQTGVITPVGTISESRSRLRRVAVVLPSSSWLGAGYNISRIRDTLVGSAADAAALRLVEKLNQSPLAVPGRAAAVPVVQDTLTLAFPEGTRPAPGAEYGIYRGERLIARVRVTSFRDGKAICRILVAADQVRSTDVARPLEVVVPVEVQAE